MRSAILPIAFSLVLGSVPIAFAQMNHDPPNGMQFASAGRGPAGASASPYASAGASTNQHLALRMVPEPESDPDPGLSYAMPPSRARGVADLGQRSLISRGQLADPALTQGWRVGSAGVLSYTARNQRWRFVFDYAPDLGALRENFSHMHSFSLGWQFSLGKLKPASWAEVKGGSELMRRPAAR